MPHPYRGRQLYSIRDPRSGATVVECVPNATEHQHCHRLMALTKQLGRPLFLVRRDYRGIVEPRWAANPDTKHLANIKPIKNLPKDLFTLQPGQVLRIAPRKLKLYRAAQRRQEAMTPCRYTLWIGVEGWAFVKRRV